MSRRAIGQNATPVTLFPFLAVLICTMGALIVLLVVMVQQAQRQTREVATAEQSAAAVPAPVSPAEIPLPPHAAAPAISDNSHLLEQQLQDAVWYNDELAQSRQRTRAKLEEQRIALGQTEDQTRQLSDKLDMLERQAENILATEDGQSLPVEQKQAELTRLKQEIDAAKQRLAAAKEAAKHQSTSYALVTYQGPNSTHRRPIYIECLKDSVVLQPEGIRLALDEFRTPGPANPLAAALRTTREYLGDAGLTTKSEPYPLLIVRPGAAAAFAACRQALKGWDDDWGYELLPDDVQLTFPEVDQALAAVLSRKIAHLRSANPMGGAVDNRSRRTTDQVYGLGQAGSVLVPQGSGYGPGMGARPAGNGRSRNANAGGDRSAPAGFGASTYAGSGGPTRHHDPSVDGRFGNGVAGNASSPSGVAGSPSASTGRPSSFGAGNGTSNGTSAFADGSGYGPGGDEPSRNFAFDRGQGGGSDAGDGGGQGSSGSDGNSQDATNPSFASHGGAGGSAATSSSMSGGPTSTSTSGATPGGASAGAADSSAGAPSLTVSATKSIAATRGNNWALPGTVEGSIGISRPMRVVCGLTALSLLPEAGSSQRPQSFEMVDSVEEALQPFVKRIWQSIDSWGIAGTGVYWKPVLQVHVEPGAEEQFQTMVRLLKDSGLEVRQHQFTPVRSAPRSF